MKPIYIGDTHIIFLFTFPGAIRRGNCPKSQQTGGDPATPGGRGGPTQRSSICGICGDGKFTHQNVGEFGSNKWVISVKNLRTTGGFHGQKRQNYGTHLGFFRCKNDGSSLATWKWWRFSGDSSSKTMKPSGISATAMGKRPRELWIRHGEITVFYHQTSRENHCFWPFKLLSPP